MNCPAVNIVHSDISKIVETLLGNIAYLLKSYQEIDGRHLFLQIQVLSSNHLADRARRGKPAAPVLRSVAGTAEVGDSDDGDDDDDDDEVVGANFSKMRLPPNLLANHSHKAIWNAPTHGYFENKCLLSTAIYGYYYNRYHKHLYDRSDPQGSRIFKRIRYAHDTSAPAQRQMSQNHLQELIEKEQRGLGLHDGPYKLKVLLGKLASKWKVRFQVFSNEGSSKTLCIPSRFDRTHAQILFYKEKYCNWPIAHVSLVLNLSSFRPLSSYACDHCGRDRGRKHFCADKVRRCFSCRRLRVKAHDKVYINNRNKNLFCTEKTARKIDYTCSKCNVKIETDACKKRHKCFLWACPDCKRVTYLNGACLTLEMAKNKHRCGSQYCRGCYQQHDEGRDHLCELKPFTTKMVQKNLAFFDFECRPQAAVEGCAQCSDKEQHYCNAAGKVWDRADIRELLRAGTVEFDKVRCKRHAGVIWEAEASSAEACEVCNGLEQTYCEQQGDTFSRKQICELLERKVVTPIQVRCSRHLNKIWDRAYHQPNYLVMHLETHEREKISRVEFAEDVMAHDNDCTFERNVITAPYLPAFVARRDLNHKHTCPRGSGRGPSSSKNEFRGETWKNSDYKDENGDFVLDKESYRGYTPAEKMILFIFRNKLRNYTFISHGGPNL